MAHPKGETPQHDSLDIGKHIQKGADKAREIKDKASSALDEFSKKAQSLGKDVSEGMQKFIKEGEARQKAAFEKTVKDAKEKDIAKNLEKLTPKEQKDYLKGLKMADQLYSILHTVRHKPTGQMDWKFNFEKDDSKYSFHVSCDDESTDAVIIEITKTTTDKETKKTKTEKFVVSTRRDEQYLKSPLESGSKKEASPVADEDQPVYDELVGPTENYVEKGRFYTGQYSLQAGRDNKGNWYDDKNKIGTIETSDLEVSYHKFKQENLGDLQNFMNSVVLPALKANAPKEAAKVRAADRKEQREWAAREKDEAQRKTVLLANLQKGPTQPNAEKAFRDAIQMWDNASFLQNAKLYKNEPYFVPVMKEFLGLDLNPEADALFMKQFADFKDVKGAADLLKTVVNTTPMTFARMYGALEKIDSTNTNKALAYLLAEIRPTLIRLSDWSHGNPGTVSQQEQRLENAYYEMWKLYPNNAIIKNFSAALPARKEDPERIREREMDRYQGFE